MGLFYCLGPLVYATRIPERWLPGKFDFAGHSHQLFHILVVAGACVQSLSRWIGVPSMERLGRLLVINMFRLAVIVIIHDQKTFLSV